MHENSLGRPIKLTDEIKNIIVKAISDGLPQNHACAIAGIHIDTFHDWLKRAESGDKRFIQFSEAIKKAKAEGIQRRLKRMESSAELGNWQIDAWYLERVYPEEFGRRDRIDHTVRALTPEELRKLPDDELARLLKDK